MECQDPNSWGRLKSSKARTLIKNSVPIYKLILVWKHDFFKTDFFEKKSF